MFFKEATSGRNNPLYYLITTIAVVIAYSLGSFPLILLQLWAVKKNPELGTAEVNKFFKTMDFSIIGISSNVGLIAMIMVFVFALLAFMVCLAHLHKRPFQNIITPKSKIDYKKIFFGFGLWLVISIALEGGTALMNPEHYYLNLKPLSWVFLLLICLFILPIQTSMEELFLRGYVMPGLSLLTKNKWLPLLLSSILFGLIHGANPEVEKFGIWTMMTYYIGAGLFLGLITILDDSLELALGVHAATNLFGAALFSFDGSVLQTDSIVKASQINPLHMTILFFVGAIIFMIICTKRYSWPSMKTVLDPIIDQQNKDVVSTL